MGAAALLVAVTSGCTAPAPAAAVHGHHASGPAAAPTGVPAVRTSDSSCEVTGPAPAGTRLRSVELVVAQEQLVIAFTLTEPVTDELTVKVVASSDATGAGAGAGFSLTAAVRGNQPVALALQTPTSTTAADRPGDFVHVEGDQIHIGVPGSLVELLGRRWHWSASSASATARASCPATADQAGPAAVAVPRPA